MGIFTHKFLTAHVFVVYGQKILPLHLQVHEHKSGWDGDVATEGDKDKEKEGESDTGDKEKKWEESNDKKKGDKGKDTEGDNTKGKKGRGSLITRANIASNGFDKEEEDKEPKEVQEPKTNYHLKSVKFFSQKMMSPKVI